MLSGLVCVVFEWVWRMCAVVDSDWGDDSSIAVLLDVLLDVIVAASVILEGRRRWRVGDMD